ncbi:hypothetical protein AB1L88_04105 [Tautonia sp. JC769]|uniref:hypothetical protein n=1 Tax=Tautonia sp. JC769 TaxID=3232135 RepID=UPI003457AABA
MRCACLVVCSWFVASSLAAVAQDGPSRELYRASVFNRNIPILREISEDGLYISHTARQVIRNSQAEIQLDGQPFEGDGISGTTWPAATMQVVQQTRDGSIVAVVSQLQSTRQDESPFNKELPAFESILYDAPPGVVVRFPAEVRGTIPELTTSFFGAPHTLRLVAAERSGHRIGDIDLRAPKAPRQSLSIRSPLDRWTSPLDRIVLGNGASFIDSNLRLVNLSGRGPESVRLDFINKVPSRFSNSAGRLSPSLDDQSLLAHYQEGLILWSFSGQQRAAFSYDPAEIPPNQAYFVAMLADDRALLMNRDDQLFLIDLGARSILARHRVNAILNEPGIQYVAGSGTYVCMKAAVGQESRAMCLKIDGDTIEGPWWAPDPETGRPLTHVTNLGAARRAPTLAVETGGHPTSRLTPDERRQLLPRILLVDLDQLTRAAPPEPEDTPAPIRRGRSPQ